MIPLPLIAALLLGAEAPDPLARSVATLSQLEAQFAAEQGMQRGQPAPGDEEVTRARLSEAELQFVSGGYAKAATILYDLVSEPGFRKHRRYPDALSLLAEALAAQGNPVGARRYLRELLSHSPEARRKALPRFIELSGELNELSGIEPLLDEARRAGPLPPELAYVAGKWMFSRTDLPPARRLDPAEATFTALARPGPFQRPSAFFLALISLERGELEKAASGFEALTRNTPGAIPTARDRELAVLAALSLGRVRFEQGRYADAVRAYALVPDGHPHHDEALFEAAWADAKAGDLYRATERLERLLGSNPDSLLVPEAKLLRGHLLLQQRRYEEAEATYEGVIDDAQAISDELSAVLAGYGGDQGLPPVALQWTGTDAQVKDALRMISELDRTAHTRAEAARIAAGVTRALETKKLEIFPSVQDGLARNEALANALAAEHARLVTLELTLVSSALSEPERAQLAAAEPARAALEARFALLPRDADAVLARRAAMQDRVDALDAQAAKLATELTGLEALRSAAQQYLASNAPDSAATPGDFGLLPALEREARAHAGAREALTSLREQLRIERATCDATLGGERQIRQSVEAWAERQDALAARAAARLAPAERVRFEQVEAQRSRVRALDAQVATARKVLEWQLASRGEGFRERAAEEGAQLKAADGKLQALTRDARALAQELARARFAKVKGEFDARVLEAELGLLDVAFTRKQQRTEAIQDLSARKERDLAAFDAEFREVLEDGEAK